MSIFLVVLSWACSLKPLNTIALQLGCVNPYFWTPIRMGPYVIGILMAYLLFRTDFKVPNTSGAKWMLVGWAINAALLGILVVAPSVVRAFNPEGPTCMTTWSTRTTVERLLWSTAVCWVIYACSVGYGGIISEFLSWKLWQPLSRLSYVAYLIHPLILCAFCGHYSGPIFYSGCTWFILFVGYSVWSFAGAFVVSVGVEIPLSELEKHILPRRHGRKLENS
ncbi:O-acyltransferase like protein-like isoform X2 [Branchiostoma floridae x Branchiostoma belcheri]